LYPGDLAIFSKKRLKDSGKDADFGSRHMTAPLTLPNKHQEKGLKT